jgi:sarcosine oxidase
MAPTFDTIIVGLGGVGTAAAYQLSHRGQRVLGIERFEIGHRQGSSHGETRIIRLAYFEGTTYVPIVRRAYELWQDLGRAAGSRLLYRTGSLEMSEPGYDFVDRSRASCLDHGLAHEMLDVDQVKRRFPAFELRPGTRAIYQPDGGYVLCEEAIGAHARLARSAGAELHTGEIVQDFRATADGGVEVRTDRGLYSAGHLVLTAGPWMRQLVPSLREHLATFKQTIAWFAPSRADLFQPSAFPVFIHFGDAGEFYGLPMHSERGMKVGGPHFAREPIDPDVADRTPSAQQLAALQRFVARHLPDAASPPQQPTGCIYTKTPDEHFIVDHLPGTPQVLLISACSGHGYKFAPALGEIAADLVVDGATRHAIEQFSLARFSRS